MTNIVLNINIEEADNKSADVSSLVKKTVYNAKLSDTEKKCFATSDYNKFTYEVLHAKIK